MTIPYIATGPGNSGLPGLLAAETHAFSQESVWYGWLLARFCHACSCFCIAAIGSCFQQMLYSLPGMSSLHLSQYN